MFFELFTVSSRPFPIRWPTACEVLLVQESYSSQTVNSHWTEEVGSHPRSALAREDFPTPVLPTITIRGSGSVKAGDGWIVELEDVQKADGNKKSKTATRLSFMVTVSRRPEYFQCARVGTHSTFQLRSCWTLDQRKTCVQKLKIAEKDFTHTDAIWPDSDHCLALSLTDSITKKSILLRREGQDLL